uniref:Uncharacterized protein n=1 Tax=Romanomermis culicivorax TaxID=13658 RepID=A0A915KNI1_ROMCU
MDQKTNELTKCQNAHPRVASTGEVPTKDEIFSSRLKKSIIERKILGIWLYLNVEDGEYCLRQAAELHLKNIKRAEESKKLRLKTPSDWGNTINCKLYLSPGSKIPKKFGLAVISSELAFISSTSAKPRFFFLNSFLSKFIAENSNVSDVVCDSPSSPCAC